MRDVVLQARPLPSVFLSSGFQFIILDIIFCVGNLAHFHVMKLENGNFNNF